MFTSFECAHDEHMHGGDFLSGAPARLRFLRDLHVNAGERRRYLVGILAARYTCVEHRDHGRRGDGPDPRRRVGDGFNVQHGRPTR